jgi:hypothetical protein
MPKGSCFTLYLYIVRKVQRSPAAHVAPVLRESEGVSNGLSGKRKFRVFQEVINEYDQLPHHCGEG